MTSFLPWLGRLAFFGLFITQSIFLSTYLAEYDGKSNWYFMALFFSPALAAWIYLPWSRSVCLRRLFRIWFLYIVAFVINIATVFGFVGDRISKTEFLSLNVLKAILCITPILLLLLLTTSDLGDSEESKKGREIVSKIYLPMAFDLFDGIEIIYIVLEEREHEFGISKEITITLVSLSFIVLVIPWQMVETRLTEEGWKTRVRTAMYHHLLQIFLVNIPFLVIRTVVFFTSGRDESIFVAKNGIGIILSSREIRNLRRSRQVGRVDYRDERDLGHQVQPEDHGDQRDRGNEEDLEDEVHPGDQINQRDHGHQLDEEDQRDQPDRGNERKLGIQASPGDQINQGHRGDQGDEEDQGDQRDRGNEGGLGDKVHPGDQINQGHHGDQGDEEYQGDQRDRGNEGGLGDKVHPGDQINQGHHGDQGDEEYQGDQRERGNEGDLGDEVHSGDHIN